MTFGFRSFQTCAYIWQGYHVCTDLLCAHFEWAAKRGYVSARPVRSASLRITFRTISTSNSKIKMAEQQHERSVFQTSRAAEHGAFKTGACDSN